MRVGTPGFVPGRLIEARAARRIPSQKALAALLSITAPTVSKWENGLHAPDAEALGALAEKLQVRREFFLRPLFVSDRPLFYRSLSSTLVRDLNYQEAQMHWLHEVAATVGHYVDFPTIDIPDVLAGVSYKQLRDDDIERIALDLRKHWSLGEGPCPDMVRLLERVGCIVGSIEMGTAKLDGLCGWSNDEGRPHILLATDKMSYPRRQMDAAHELGHALLHRNVSAIELKKNLREIETQAFRFASAFLMPSTTYPYEVRTPSIASLLSMKERWRVAVKAQIMRLSQLGLIPDDHKVTLYKLHSAKGWNKGEPLDDNWPLTSPQLLHEALNLIVDSGVRTKADLLSVEFTMQAGDIENIASLPAGWFAKTGELVTLKLKDERKHEGGPSAEIIPFARK